ncbi:helix-turn-helix transcriptional regulator [Dethiosulfovibrio salsuginis]|uniref:Predicted DNA-binding transcriptional regulator YafY, contains an HTH and WYL domains n=1 Tax=Dethiosulfovibrio salsuginis TaxID=561720 RepID=A0A1X7IM85_9BACT|nr:WYL domain-containing protein [Dethiosulfovibrio salsuginis]SMG16033.1 Predicted DNA-binding transcriptional regulator YafY, contains an HTH and WYL domains [Dethiosulfovibrio salsuginis]
MPKDTSSVKLDRLNRLMGILYSGRAVTKNLILDEIGYTTSRTFERDMAFLREAYMVDIRYDRLCGGYILEGRGSFILNFTLREKEILALIAGLRMSSHFLPHLDKDAQELWAKMRSSLPESLLNQGDILGQSVVLSLPVSQMDPRAFDTILEAIKDLKNIQFSYRSPYGQGNATTRVVSPWGVFFQSHAWYLWGSHPKVPKGVTYRISRIKSIITSPDTTFAKPPEGTDIVGHSSSGWYGYTGDASIPVKIEISQPLGDIVKETLWHPTQSFLDRDDGVVVMTAEVPDIGAVARWIMASAPHAKAKEPEELVQKVAELAHGMAKEHEVL